MALGLAFSQHSAAQETADQPKLQRVEITGSSIKRTEQEAAGSIQILNRDDIERTGETSALGILNASSAISTSINSSTSSSGSFATGSSAVGMRGLGKVATLVLVNGQRIAQYGLADGAQENFTNLDAIPAAAIDRIEILKDGASAIYGSDAIAGVVNIILRKDFEGAKITGNYKESDGFRDQRNRSVSGIVGWGDIDKNGFNTYLTYEAYKSDGFSVGDLRSHYPEWHRQTPARSTWDAKSVFSPTGNYLQADGKQVRAAGCPTDAIDPADGLCKLDVLPYTGLSTNAKRYAVASNTHFRIGKSVDANFEITAAGASNDYIVPPLNASNGSATSSSSTWYNAIDGKMVGPFFYPKLPVGHPNNPYNVPVEYRARLMDTGNGFNFNRTESDQSRAMLSLSGDIRDFDWKSSVGYMKSTATKATRAASAKGYTDAIVNGTYKFGQQNDYALLDSMFPVRTTTGESKIAFANAVVSGEVMQLPAGPLSVAFGTDIRQEKYEMASSDNVLRGELVGIAGLQVKDTMDHYALFAEATIPVIKRVELSAALRADKSTNSDVHYSPKLGLRYNATDSLLLRATVSGGFRAPNVVETGNGLGRSSFATNVTDPRRCEIASTLGNLVPASATADKTRANTFVNADCKAGIPTFVSSNKDLKPETSRSVTAGFVFEPVKNWTMALDYYHIERKDEIGTRPVSDILRGEASLPAGQLVRVDNSASDAEFITLVKKYAPNTTVNFGGVGAIGLLYNPYVNSGKTRASGFDFDASGRFNTDLGQVRLKLEGSYLWKYQQYSVANGAYDVNMAGTYDLGSRLNTKLRGYLKSGNFDNGLTLNYLSGFSNNSLDAMTYCATNKVAAANLDTCGHVGSNTTVDYNLAYTGIKNTKLMLYIDNLFDQAAPIQWRRGYADSFQFRRIGVSASYTFF
ncbi:TonB-dependent receptor [Duganella sp. Leaf126]|uniref:TonB-dependent receptor plug domain-containing protein n=1 Tax=Duganella sp. Leaf126 TaxID=1736266 RepID=UPI0006F350DE|nr:TonB-dependent receptor [Duganella sp. Leaf126]KQQ47675.1 TonB-dependent receptor [Duganella sp. Leaf126]